MSLRFTPKTAIALALGVSLALAPTASMAIAPDAEPGILVEDVVHELPAPSVALASDGRSLVVYQSADPDADPTDTNVCDANGRYCVTLAVIVDADGTTVSEPVVVSGDLELYYYYSAPQVMWNDELGEWLVIMTDYESDPQSLFAQRVGSNGALIGSLVELPSQSLTTYDDRSTTIETSMSSHILPNISWSSELDAYFVTWVAVGSVNGYVAVGYFMNADLTSYDGVDAGFLISSLDIDTEYLSRQSYNPVTGDWAVSWIDDGTEDIWVTGVSFDGTTLLVSSALRVVQGSSVTGLFPQGGLTWVASQNAWLVSFGAESGSGSTLTYDVYGRYITGDLFGTPVVGPSIAMTDHGTSRLGTLVSEGRGHEIQYDAPSDTVYAAGTIRFRDPATNRFIFGATTWSFDPATNGFSDVVELFAPDDELAVVDEVQQSSRARLSVFSNGVAVVWQNWLGGDWEEPTQVRFALLEDVVLEAAPETAQPELADTGAAETAAVGGLAVALLALGAAFVVTRRRVSTIS